MRSGRNAHLFIPAGSGCNGCGLLTGKADASLDCREFTIDKRQTARRPKRLGIGTSRAVTPQVFTDLLAELQRAAELLRGIPPNAAPDPQLAEEIVDYRRNVQRLEKTLPAIQERLLTEKARLESARAHLAAAAAWVDARKKTL